MVLIPKIPKAAFADLVEPNPKAVRLGADASRTMTESYGSVDVGRMERHLGSRLKGLRLSGSRAYALVKRVAKGSTDPSPEEAARLAFISSIIGDGSALLRYDELENAVGDNAPLSTDEIRLSLGGKQVADGIRQGIDGKKPLAAAKQLITDEGILLKSPWLLEDSIVHVDVAAADADLKSAAANRDPLTPFHAVAAEEAKEGMSPDELEAYRQMAAELSPLASKFMEKALAMGYDLASLGDFFREIEGQNDGWLRANLTAADPQQGRGIAQQWMSSCAAATAQSLRAEVDPIYALGLHQSNQDIYSRWNGAAYEDGADELGPNGHLARDQERLSRASVTDDPKGAAAALVPVWRGEEVAASFPGVRDMATMLDVTFRDLPLNFKTEYHKMDVKKLDAVLRQGLPVLMSTENEDGDGHGVTILARVRDKGKLAYLVHDPSSGIVKTINASQLDRGSFPFAGDSLTPLYFESIDKA